MSPFDLQGPEFLVFYLVLGGCILLALRLWRYAGEGEEPPALNLSDPYLIAYLRGGKNETLRVATVSLIDRGLLAVSGSKLSVARDRSASAVSLPIEQRLLSCFNTPAEAASVFKASIFDRETDRYKQELIRLELLPGAAAQSARALMLGTGLLVLWGVALAKIVVALSRGRTNIQFLLALAAVLTFAAFKLSLPRLTRKGAAMIASLKVLFNSLKERAPSLVPGQNASELLLLAAVFGVGMIPSNVFPHTKRLYPQAASSGSCGSTCGSSCGSGCGGGGCGGGCGGCGS